MALPYGATEKHSMWACEKEREAEDDWTLRVLTLSDGVGWCCPSGSCHAPSMLLLALAVSLTFYITASALCFSHPQAHGTTRHVRLSGKVLLETSSHSWMRVIYLVLIFTVHVRSAEHPDQKSYFIAVLWHICITKNCIYCRLNQTWADTSQSKSTTKWEFLTGIDLELVAVMYKDVQISLSASFLMFLRSRFTCMALALALINLDTKTLFCKLLERFRKFSYSALVPVV